VHGTEADPLISEPAACAPDSAPGGEAHASRRAHAALERRAPEPAGGQPPGALATARRQRSGQPPEAGSMEPLYTLVHEQARRG